MYRKLLFLAALFSAAVSNINAQTPVWSTDVAPILFNKCASCHRTGGIAPFSLTTYSEAVLKAPSISGAVQARTMPPWPPDPTFSRLAHERLLSQQEIDKIKNWVSGSTPQGDPTKAPPVPTFSATGELAGTPDLVAQIPSFTSTATTGDVYQCFVVPSNLLTDKFITAFEAIPGNRPIVHHVLVYADTTGVCKALDAAEPGPGYVSFGGVGSNDAKLIGGWVPGTSPIKYPNGFGVRLPKNSDIIIQIHYPQGSGGQTDDTKINFFFAPTNNVRPVSIDPVLHHLGGPFVQMTPGTLTIPAGQTRTYTQKSLISALMGEMSILGVAPHMHLIGRNISVFGVTPSGDTSKYIKINNWDFHWQGFYLFPKIRKMQSGTTLYSKAFYDNTSSNPFNPHNPPQDVHAGEATDDEMMLTYFIYSNYQPGDENIVIDSNVATGIKKTNAFRDQELFEPYPNPASNQLIVKTYLAKADQVSIQITNAIGQVVKTLAQNEQMGAGYAARTYSVSDLPNGMYHIRFTTSERMLFQKLVVQH